MLINQLRQLSCQDKAILKYLLIESNEENRIITILNNHNTRTFQLIRQNLQYEIVDIHQLHLKQPDEYLALFPSDSLINLLVEYSLQDIFERLYENLNAQLRNTIRTFADNPYRKTYQFEKELDINYDAFRKRLSTIYEALLINHLICYGNPNNPIQEDNKRTLRKQLLILLLKYKLDLFTKENLKIILQKLKEISSTSNLREDISRYIDERIVNDNDIAIPPGEPPRRFSYFSPSYFYLERPHTIGEKSIEQECMENIDKESLTKIKGSSQTGKTFLIDYLVNYINERKPDYILVDINFKDIQARLDQYKDGLNNNLDDNSQSKRDLLNEMYKWFYQFLCKQIQLAVIESEDDLKLLIRKESGEDKTDLENINLNEKVNENLEQISDNISLQNYLQNILLNNIGNTKIIIFLDNFDLVLELEKYLGFGQTLRKWFELTGRKKQWRKISWFVAYSTEIYFDLETCFVSPLKNVGMDINLSDFSHEQITEIAVNQANDIPNYKELLTLTNEDLQALSNLIQGNPALVRESLTYIIRMNKRLLNIFNEEVISYTGKFKEYNGLFYQHLRQKLEALEKSSPKTTAVLESREYQGFIQIPQDVQTTLEQELFFNFLKVIQKQLIVLDPKIAWKLECLGLIEKVDRRYKPKYQLYSQFFSLLLCEH